MALLLVFTLAVVAALSRTVFFFITDFEVMGNEKYSKDEIVAAAGISPGENLFVADKKGAREHILSALPYIEEAKVKMSLPSTIKIEVIETKAVCLVESFGEYFVADENSKILERAEGSTLGLIPLKSGEESQAVIGEIYLGDENARENLKIVLNALKENALSDSIIFIDVSDRFDLKIGYNENLTIKLGTSLDLDKKFAMLKTILPKILEGERGEINLSNPQKVYFESKNG